MGATAAPAMQSVSADTEKEDATSRRKRKKRSKPDSPSAPDVKESTSGTPGDAEVKAPAKRLKSRKKAKRSLRLLSLLAAPLLSYWLLPRRVCFGPIHRTRSLVRLLQPHEGLSGRWRRSVWITWRPK